MTRHRHQRGEDDEAETSDHGRRGDGILFWRCAYWTARGVIPRWQLFGVYLLIAGVGVLGFHQIGNQADRAEALAVQNRTLAKESAALAKRVQQQRLDNIRASCEETNARNKATKDKLRAAAQRDIDRAEPELFKDEIRGRRDTTLALIDALQPTANCDEAVARAQSPPKPKPSPSPSP